MNRTVPSFDVDGVLFDFDGTLIEPSIDFGRMRREIAALATRHSVVDADLATMPALEVIARARVILDTRQQGLGDAFATEADLLIRRLETDAARWARPYPGVPALLMRLARSGLRVGIVTRNCRMAVEEILSRTTLHHDVMLTRDDVAYVKPDPRHLTDALDALHVLPARAVMVGDHPMDVVAGQRAGTYTVGVVSPGGSRLVLEASGAHLLLDNVTDLAQYVNGGHGG